MSKTIVPAWPRYTFQELITLDGQKPRLMDLPEPTFDTKAQKVFYDYPSSGISKKTVAKIIGMGDFVDVIPEKKTTSKLEVGPDGRFYSVKGKS